MTRFGWQLLAVLTAALFFNPIPTGHTQEAACVDPFDVTAVIDPQAWAPLPAGLPMTAPVFCNDITRIDDSSQSGQFETPEYSQLQAFSDDNTYMLLVSSEGYRVRRTADLSVVDGLETWTWNAARWYDDTRLIHYDSNDDTTVRVQLTDVTSGTVETVFTFPAQYDYVQVAPSTEELSRDRRWMAGILQRNDGEWVIFALDVDNRALGTELSISALYSDSCAPDPEWGMVPPNWVGVSPLGNYLVLAWTRDGTAPCSGLESYDLITGAFVGRAYDGHQHGDLGVTEDGREFYMTFEIYHPSGNPAIGLRELPGNDVVSEPEYLTVLDWGNTEHISCQGPAGVCLVTAGTLSDNGWNPLEGELFLQYTDGRVRRLVQHQSSSCGYWVQPRASLSRDGHLALFASDWGNPQQCDDLGRGDAYLLQIAAVD